MNASDKHNTECRVIMSRFSQENVNLVVTFKTVITKCNNFSASDEKEINQPLEDSAIACRINVIIEK